MVKDQEYLVRKASYCLDLAKKYGATNSSIIVNNSISETVNFRNQKLDESNRSDNLGVNITTYINKKKSSISSSNLLDDNLETLIEKCVETTKNTPEDEFNALPDKDVFNTGDVSVGAVNVLFVRVCVPDKVTTVASIANCPDDASIPVPAIPEARSAIVSFLEALLSFASIIAILSFATSTVAAVNSLRSSARVTSPLLPPPDRPLPAVTAVMSPVIPDVKLALVILRSALAPSS